jgi:hypothetical protein
MFEPHIQFHHKLRTIMVDETPTMEKVKTLKIMEWTLSQDINRFEKSTWG